MHFTLPVAALLCVFQVVVALPAPFASLDSPAILSRRATEQRVGSNEEASIQAKCFGGWGGGLPGFGTAGIWGNNGFPFTAQLFGGLMNQFGFGNSCGGFFNNNNIRWGQCNFISDCMGGFNTFQNVFLPQFANQLGGPLAFGGGFGNNIFMRNEEETKSDTNAV